MEAKPELVADESLARQAQSGSLPAFDELVTRYYKRVYGFVVQCCSNRDDAAEITQDTFVKAFHAIQAFDASRSFATWLFTIARRKCIDHYRAAPQRRDEAMPELPDHRTPRDQLQAKENCREIWALARRTLPEIQYQALWLKYAEDMEIPAVAQVLRKTRTHVKVILFRARRVLARHLASVDDIVQSRESGSHAGNAPAGIPLPVSK